MTRDPLASSDEGRLDPLVVDSLLSAPVGPGAGGRGGGRLHPGAGDGGSRSGASPCDGDPRPPRMICLITIEMDAATIATTAALIDSLTAARADHVDLEPDPEVSPYPFACWDVTAPRGHAGDVDRGALHALVWAVADALDRWPELGASVFLCPGGLGLHGPIGPAAQIATSAAAPPQAGVLTLDPASAQALGEDALGALRARPDSRTFIGIGRHHAPDAEGESFGVSTSPRGVTHAVQLHVEALRGSGYRREPVSARVASPGEVAGPPLNMGDRLQVRFTCPDALFVYPLLQRNGAFSPLGTTQPLRAPGGPTECALEWIVDDVEAVERPALLVSDLPLASAADVIASLNERQGPGGRGALTDLLQAMIAAHPSHAGPAAEIGIVHAPAYRHAGGQCRGDPDLDAGTRAHREGRLQEALTFLRDCARRLPLGADQLNARIQLGRILHRLQSPWEALEILTCAEREALAAGQLSPAGDAARYVARVQIDRACHPLAERYLAKALRWHTQAQDSVGVGWDHLQEAVSLWAQGSYDLSQQAYEAALTLARRERDLRLLSATLLGSGQNAHELGHLDLAAERLNGALASYLTARDAFGEMRVRGEIGLLALQRQRGEEAVSHITIQVQIARRVAKPRALAQCLINLAMALNQTGHPGQALTVLDEAAQLLEARDRVLGVGVALLSGRAATLLGDWALAERHLEPLDPADRSLPITLRWEIALAQGALLDERAVDRAEQAYRAGIEAIEEVREGLELSQRTAFLATSQALWQGWIGHLVRRGAEGDVVLAAVDRSRARAFLDALMTWHPGVSFRGDSPLDPADPQGAGGRLAHLRAALGPDTAVLVTQRLGERLLLVWATAAGVTYTLSEAPAADIDAHADALHRLTANPRLPGDPGPHLDALGRALFGPLGEALRALPADGNLVCIPDGKLHGIPVHALPHPAGGVIVDRACVSYAPSVSALDRWLSLPAAPPSGVQIFADPQGDLPHARLEALWVRGALGEGQLHQGAEVTASRFFRACHGAGIIHAAVHAVRRRGDSPAALRLAPAGRLPGGGLSGGRAEDDGQVGIPDLATLNLSAQLVTLSACEAGGGALNTAGDGPDVLSWAFLASGARSVVASGWAVPDADTATLMARFYAELAAGASRSLALARAQRALRRDAPATTALHPPSDPRRWAAFCLTGDWRPLPAPTPAAHRS